MHVAARWKTDVLLTPVQRRVKTVSKAEFGGVTGLPGSSTARHLAVHLMHFVLTARVRYDSTVCYLIMGQRLFCHCGNPLSYKRRSNAT
jgi:hypothetical protein